MTNWLAETIFGIMFGAALLLGETPLGRPLKWAETFYHEMSHGLICLLTGGRIRKLEIEWNGAGCCTTVGGWRVPTLLAGYLGASLWGGVLYIVGWLLGTHGATLWLKVEVAVLAFVTLFWVRNFTTLIIMLFIGGTYGLAIAMPETQWLPFILQFIGIYVMLNAIRAPLYLIDGRHVGDGAMLADIFHILPEGFWIFLWFTFALFMLGVCMVMTLPHLAWIGPYVPVLKSLL
jgi:hypothetical protein